MTNFTTIPFTYQQLVEVMEMAGNNLALCAIERMMVIVEEETGVFPDWSDFAPQWVINQAFGKDAV